LEKGEVDKGYEEENRKLIKIIVRDIIEYRSNSVTNGDDLVERPETLRGIESD
jgi:hypothetical protein